MFRNVITTVIMGLVVLAGCRQRTEPVTPTPKPPPIPAPGPTPAPIPDVDIDPNDPETITKFNVTFEQMQKDIVGKWVTLNSSQRWTFHPNDQISLSKVGDSTPTVLSKTHVVVDTRVIASRPGSDVTLSGFIKLRYEQVDGKWFLTEVIRVTVDKYTTKK